MKKLFLLFVFVLSIIPYNTAYAEENATVVTPRYIVTPRTQTQAPTPQIQKYQPQPRQTNQTQNQAPTQNQLPASTYVPQVKEDNENSAAEETLAELSEKNLGLYIAPRIAFAYHVDEIGLYNAGSKNAESEKKVDGSLFNGAIAIGYSFKERFDTSMRIELEYSLSTSTETKFSNNTIVSGTSLPITAKSSLSTLSTNIYFDYNNSTEFVPYFGIGAGISFSDLEVNINSSTVGTLSSTSFDSDSQTSFVCNMTLGLGYKITESFLVDFAYRYSVIGKGKTESFTYNEGSSQVEAYFESVDFPQMHQVMLGVRFVF